MFLKKLLKEICGGDQSVKIKKYNAVKSVLEPKLGGRDKRIEIKNKGGKTIALTWKHF